MKDQDKQHGVLNDCRIGGALEADGLEKTLCPFCHSRLFDAKLSAGTLIEIKCSRCKGVSRLAAL